MAWSIAEVARMAKISSRTLRHYDEVRLLAPAYVGVNGYRYYEREQLLRLQQILLLRELGLGLSAIAEVLAGQRDRADALRRHEAWLREERDRLDRLARTVARTLEHLEEEGVMSASEMFDGFADRQAQAEEELVRRYGEGVRESFAQSRERTKDWAPEDHRAVGGRFDELDERMAELLRSGAAPDAEPVLAVVEEHHRTVSRYWTPDRESYAGLGHLYVDDPQFRARYDGRAPGLAEYLRDAMTAYAERRLG